MTGRVEVRAARPAEYPAVLETVCAAFGEHVRPLMTAMLWGDPTLTDEDIRVAAVDGAIASVVRIADRPIRFGSATLRLAGIGAVSTHPDYRGQGLASLVLEDAAHAMRERGFHLGMLFTGIQPFYARLGWTPVPQPGFRIMLADPCLGGRNSPLPDLGEGAVRPFNESRDLPAVEAIYEAFNRDAYGPHLRSPEFWGCAHSRERHIMPALVAERDGETVAYASLQPRDDVMALYEAACLPGAEDAFVPLAAAAMARANKTGMREIAGWLPPGHPLRDAVWALAGDRHEEASHASMMLLPLDLSALRRLAASQGLPDWSSPLMEDAARPFVYWWPDHF